VNKTPNDWKKCPILEKKVAQTVAQPKRCQNIYFKTQLKSPIHLPQTTFKTGKYLQQTMF
jgi:hypothetical protein